MKGVVFDFDGPLFPGRKAARTALHATYDHFAQLVGRPRQTMTTAPLYPPSCMIDAAYAEFDLPRDRLSEIRAYYSEQVRSAERALAVAVDAEVVRLLDGLVARGCRLAVLTSRSNTNVNELLKHLGLSNRFKLVVGSNGDPNEKLDPAMFPKIAKQLSLQVGDLVLVGDSDTDCNAAQTAGIPYFHVAWSGEPTSDAQTRATAVANSVGDLEAIFSDDKPLETYRETVLPPQLVDAIRAGAHSFFAGAGASVPSGIGDWATHYLPLLRSLGAGSLLGPYSLPQILQLLCTSLQDESRIFDAFRNSFRLPGKKPNAYHYAMLKSRSRTIWTTNYDQLFEHAVHGHSFEHIVVKNDDELLNNFSARSLVIKLNGDFEGAKFEKDLEWGMVFVEEQFDTAEFQRRETWRLFEDHYRNKLLVFVGVSFTDPALRRILSVAAKAIPRSRYQHLLLMKVPENPLERIPHWLHAEALKRRHIRTLFFDDFASIETFVCRVAAQALRPIVGFSGTARLDLPLIGAAGAAVDPKSVEEWCAAAGRALAGRNFRVTSGHGEGVGVPAVTAAFEKNPTSARFYLRKRGTTKFSRLAPAIVVHGDTLEDMRARFVSELDLLIAVGGQKTQEVTSGTAAEIKLALDNQVPVLIFPQAGGDAACFAPELAAHVRGAFADKAMADAVCKANARIAAVPGEDLAGFMENELPDLTTDLIAQMMGTQTNRPRDAIDQGPGSDW